MFAALAAACVDHVSNNQPRIGRGCYRNVYGLGKYVLKVDQCREPYVIQSCQTEAEFWEMIKNTTDRVYFAPVVAYGDGWVLMERIPRTQHNPGAGRNIGNTAPLELRTVAQRWGIGDLHDANWGWHNGYPTIVDYASQPSWLDPTRVATDALNKWVTWTQLSDVPLPPTYA